MLGVATFVALAFATAAPDGVRPCSARAEGGSPAIDGRRDIRIGPVVFLGLRRPERQAFPGAHGHDRGYKIPILVRAGAPVLLRIPPQARRDIGLNYAMTNIRRVADGQGLVRVEPCAPDTPRFSGDGRVGAWTGFSGGFVVRRRGCYPLDVARRGRPFARRRIALGRRC